MADMGKNTPKAKAKVAKVAKEKPTTGDKEDNLIFSGVNVMLLQKIKADALIGYRVMKMFPTPKGAQWGKFNDQKVDDNWVNELTKNFKGSLDNCYEDSAMDVILDRSWLKELEEGTDKLKILEGKNLSKVPELRFTPFRESNVANNNLWIMGGNHRQLALIKFVDNTKGDLKKIEAELAKTSKVNKKMTQFYREAVDNENRLKDEVSRKKEGINRAQKWVVRVYDRGVQTSLYSKDVKVNKE